MPKGRVENNRKYIEMTIDDWIKTLRSSNEVLRSAYQIALRSGKNTHWKEFTIRVEDELKEQHHILSAYNAYEERINAK
jgi:uncharacterized protein YeaO (DUF488 family)